MDHDTMEDVEKLLKIVEMCTKHGNSYKNIGRVAAQTLGEIEAQYAPAPAGLQAEPAGEEEDA